jgi:hypothetical protein
VGCATARASHALLTRLYARIFVVLTDDSAKLLIAGNTVEVRLRHILDKLRLRSRTQAAAFAVREVLVRVVLPIAELSAERLTPVGRRADGARHF